MSIASSIPSGTMGSTSDRVTSVAAASALDATSPPVTPPTKSSGPNAGSASQSSLPSPPPSSSSRHSRTVEQDELDYDNDHNSNIYPSGDHNNSQSSIEQIARRLPSSTNMTSMKTGSGKNTTSSTHTITKTHSSSSSTSSLASTHQQLPSTLNNKHISAAKSKTLGHLARSTSSEVDSEVANALASGRSIVSKTDWKEEDAQYLVQLIEAQFPKGNIIWDWVGHQMVDRGFTKSQCRSKWKRIRTKVLHGDGNPHTKDRDQALEQEVDELNEDEYEELPTDIPDLKWRHQQAEQEISTSQSHSARSNASFDRPQLAFRTGPTAREEELAAIRRSQYSNRTVTQSTYLEQSGEHWSEDDERRQDIDNYLQPAKRFSDYPEQDRTPPSRSPQQHRRTSSSHHQSSAQGDDVGRSSTILSAIAATPTIFGKIEWKPEDSDYLVHLIETKFASRKVDWAYVSKQMEGRGYDRTQCKSRWWRVQHRQNQGQQSQGGSVSSPASRGGRPRKNVDRRESQPEYDQLEDEKEKMSDTEEIHPQQTLETLHEYRGHQQLQQPDTTAMRSPSIPPQQHSHPSDMGEGRPHYPQESNHRERHEDEESQGTVDDLTRSPRATRGHEHQKHIEWKEEDSQYMFRMIEREFPVGNVVWSVIGERMASRGYSQTQCMSKWRRHLKNSKTSNDITGARPSGISMDLDIDMDIDGSSAHNHHRENRLTGFRRPRKEDLLIYGDNRGSSSGGDHHSSGKRAQSDLVDSRAYDRDEFQSPTAQLDARLVEMEFDRYFNVGNKRKRTIEGEGHGNESYVGPEPAPNGYYDRGVSSSYEDESAHHHRHSHHHHRRLSSEVRHEDYPRRSSYRTDEHASSGGYGERERSRRRSSHLPVDESAVVVGEEAAIVVGSAGSAEPFEPERDSHNGERQGRRYDEREWDSAMAVDNECEEPPSLSSKSQHREPHSSRSLYADENNGRYYYDEREPTRAILDQNKAARHRPQEPARYNEPIGRSPDRGLVGTTHISSLHSSSSYPNGASSGRHRERELVSRRGNEEEEYDVVERDERHYRDQQQHHRRRSQHQPQQPSRRPSSPGRDDGGRNGHYDDNFGKHRHRQSSAEYEHHRQDYGYRQPLSSPHSHSRSGQHREREVDSIDYAMEDDLDWANGRWEGRDMARLAAAVARQGRRWDAIRAQIQIPVLASPYDDQEYADVYEGFRFEPLPSSTVDRHYSRQHHHHSSSSSHRHSQSQSYSQQEPQHQPQRHQRQPSYQQTTRQDRRKSSHKAHHRPSSSLVTVPVPGLVDGDYSQHQAPSPSAPSSKRPSGAIASVTSPSYAGVPNEISPSVTGAKTLAADVVVLDREYTEEEHVNRSRPQQDSELDDIVDADSVDQGQAPREEEEEVVMTEAAIMVESEKEVVVVDQDEEETRSLEIESMEVDEERDQEDLVQSVSAENKSSSEEDAEILQESTETVTTSMTSTTTTTVITATSAEQDVEALAMH
ncbi:MAG: hypothetical protein J3R72DRAFT_149323 [Linnemannia gamsii]|nr:MAG: hypothetical protein J3R72DRAFT_149323 [Linnemannia gamsii]